MNKAIATSLLGLLLASVSTGGSAQTLGTATAEAQARIACGAGTLVSAEYLPGGVLRVTCRQEAPTQSTPSELSGTGLTETQSIAGVFVVTLLGVAIGGGGEGTTTTTTTTERSR